MRFKRNYSRGSGRERCWPKNTSRHAGYEISRRLVPQLLFDLDIEALDFLIQGGERNVEALGGFCLIPTAFFEHVDNDVSLAFFHNIEKRSIRPGLDHGNGCAPAND